MARRCVGTRPASGTPTHMPTASRRPPPACSSGEGAGREKTHACVGRGRRAWARTVPASHSESSPKPMPGPSESSIVPVSSNSCTVACSRCAQQGMQFALDHGARSQPNSVGAARAGWRRGSASGIGSGRGAGAGQQDPDRPGALQSAAHTVGGRAQAVAHHDVADQNRGAFGDVHGIQAARKAVFLKSKGQVRPSGIGSATTGTVARGRGPGREDPPPYQQSLAHTAGRRARGGL